MSSRMASAGVLAAMLSLAAAPSPAAPGCRFFPVGNPADGVTPTRGLLVLQDGETDVDENFIAMGERSGGGDDPGGRFDLDRWRGAGGISDTLSAESGVLVSSRGEIY